MNVRAIVLAVPAALAVGSACSHAQQTGASSLPSDRQAAGERREPLAQDPLMQPGPAVQGHAGDEVVVGRIASAADDAITIETAQGETRTLQIAPETWVTLDGEDASAQDLTEGVPVRASYDEVDGEQVAVKVHAGVAIPRAQGTGSSSQESTGEPGATDPGADVGAPPDAGWGPPPDDTRR
jgi:hypothetical protein